MYLRDKNTQDITKTIILIKMTWSSPLSSLNDHFCKNSVLESIRKDRSFVRKFFSQNFIYKTTQKQLLLHRV